jgi:hypothetical protein
MYGLTLLLHSWVRWLLLALALVVLLRSLRGLRTQQAWSARDERWLRVFMGLLNLQFLFGLSLYVALSPIVRAALRDPSAAMKSAVLRFFGVEHLTAMLIALTVAHVGMARARRAADAHARHRRTLFTIVGFLLAVVIGIPWPFRPYGRPLVRSFEAAKEEVDVPEIYLARCAACHGAAGRGDGVAAGSMRPAPRDFHEGGWQRAASEARIRDAIVRGGRALGLSANMPAHPDLSEREVAELVQFVRRAPQRPQGKSSPR